MRAVGQDMDVLRDAGIKVERTRIIAIVLSTVCAGIGMVIYLQNMGNIATYSSHICTGMFCIAALLVGGASVDKASIGNAFLGVVLFHLMFIVAAPSAGAEDHGRLHDRRVFPRVRFLTALSPLLLLCTRRKRIAKEQSRRTVAAWIRVREE